MDSFGVENPLCQGEKLLILFRSPHMAQSTAPLRVPSPTDQSRNKRSVLRRFWRWVSFSKNLENAQKDYKPLSADQLAPLARAKDSLTAAELFEKPVYPLPNRSDGTVALNLYREALYWSLVAFTDGTPETVLQTIDDGVLFRGSIGPENGRALLQRLLAQTYRDAPSVQPQALAAELKLARTLVKRIVGIVEAPQLDLQRARSRRNLGRGGVVLATALLGLGAYVGGKRLAYGPDLAEGKPWRASSSYGSFSPETHLCDGLSTDVFFHTREEEDPWVEFDLQKTAQVSRIVIGNREEPYASRAVPLAVTLSTDRVKWATVGLIEKNFDVTTVKFPSQQARYVKLTSRHKTWFHLLWVRIYR